MITTKRIYEAPDASDGERYLVDRIWPRGVSKEQARLTDWLQQMAPSTELRKWYGHDPQRWSEFKRRYKLELRAQEKRSLIAALADEARNGTVTLLYGARDRRRNNAVVLQEVVEDRMQETGE